MALSLGSRPGLRRAAVAICTLPALVALGACDDGDAPQDVAVRDADVYAAIVQQAAQDLVTDHDGDGPPTVFVAPLADGAPFGLDVQVAVVDQVGEDTTVRFVDHLDQAIDREAEDEPVLDDGVLLRLGPVPATRSPVTVDGERYRSASDGVVVRYQVSRQGDTWTATATTGAVVPATAAGG